MPPGFGSEASAFNSTHFQLVPLDEGILLEAARAHGPSKSILIGY